MPKSVPTAPAPVPVAKGNRLTQKLGPLPVWAWALIGGALLLFFLSRGKHSASGSSVVSTDTLSGGANAGGDAIDGFGGASSGAAPHPVPSAPVPPPLPVAPAAPIAITPPPAAPSIFDTVTKWISAPVTNSPQGSVVVSKGSGDYATPGGAVAPGQQVVKTITGANGLPMISLYGAAPKTVFTDTDSLTNAQKNIIHGGVLS